MITEHLREKRDRVSSTPKTIEVEEKCYNDSGNSLNANALDQPGTLSDVPIKEEGLDTIEVKEDGISTSVMLHIETRESETETLELEENSTNKSKITDCTMNSQQPIRSQQVAATDDNCSIAIDIHKNDDNPKDDINKNKDS